VVPVALGFLGLLLYIVLAPFVLKKTSTLHHHSPHDLILEFSEAQTYTKKNIAVAVDFSFADQAAIHRALSLGGTDANYTLIHIVETVGAMVYGKNTQDYETVVDKKRLELYRDAFAKKGFTIGIQLGFGKPSKALPDMVNNEKYDILVMGTHGHTGIKDLLFGTTVNQLRHKISIPLLIVKN
jgi:manganese transport protein